MNSQSVQLFQQIIPLFRQNGIKSMTMDDIASNLGISKKTLYKYVEDKNDLVTKLMQMTQEEERCIIGQMVESNLNAIDQSFEISRFITEKLNDVHPSIMYDLKKYHPEAWKMFNEHKEMYISNWILENLEQGKSEGLYRADLNVEVIKDIFLARIDDILELKYDSQKKYSFSEIYLESFRYHIRGIASEKGITYLVNKIKKEKSKNP